MHASPSTSRAKVQWARHVIARGTSARAFTNGTVPPPRQQQRVPAMPGGAQLAMPSTRSRDNTRMRRAGRIEPHARTGAAVPHSPTALAAVADQRQFRGPCVVNLVGKRAADVTFNAHPHPAASLNAYMAHAVEHFASIPLPMGGKLRKLDGNRMEMTVPRIEMFDIWLQPKAVTTVNVRPNRAEITSTTGDCVLSGSHHVTKLGLNERFNLNVRIVFSWDDSESTRRTLRHHRIRVHSHLEVEVDVPPPFSFMPKPMLKATGDLAITTVLTAMAESFLGKLSKDYDAWAKALPVTA
uniref:Uncharacterized protein n=1 Tax=Chlamydomonas euryale TaxID=1486919 RepID=A0A7R9V1U0_9CHLO|mmetsp:Transcript_1025/g.2795  ORF Transcript_1025/g.2795 Transcript_1025/m.2795 type:complete len:297 (+) Transcript_1025:205-1095(+)